MNRKLLTVVMIVVLMTVNQRWRRQLALPNLSRLSLMWILTHFQPGIMLIIPAMQKNRCL